MLTGQNFFEENKSSFLIVEKNLKEIVKKLMTNQKLMKLLYYTSSDCLSKPNLSTQEIYSMFNKQIKIIPKIDVDDKCPIYLLIRASNFTPNQRNPEFRDCYIDFIVLCHPDHWNLGDFQLRPYKILGEIDNMVNKKKIVGIGTFNFSNGDTFVMNDNLMGITASYKVIYSTEDTLTR